MPNREEIRACVREQRALVQLSLGNQFFFSEANSVALLKKKLFQNLWFMFFCFTEVVKGNELPYNSNWCMENGWEFRIYAVDVPWLCV